LSEASLSFSQPVQTGTQAFKNIYGDVFKAGLMGEGAVAPLTQSQIELGQRISGLDLPGQYGTAAEAGQQAAAGLQGLQGLQATGVAAPELTQFQMAGPTSITAPELQQFQIGAPTQEALDPFMSPYMQNVVDIQQRKAIEAAQQAQLGQNLAAARQGTYGGARQTLLRLKEKRVFALNLVTFRLKDFNLRSSRHNNSLPQIALLKWRQNKKTSELRLVFNNSALVRVLRHNGPTKQHNKLRLNKTLLLS
jgi:hypothetical protein